MKGTHREARSLWKLLLVLLAGCGLLAAGAFTHYQVIPAGKQYQELAQELGHPVFERVSDFQLIVDATFGGVERESDGRLHSTYDRLRPGGKRPCPT